MMNEHDKALVAWAEKLPYMEWTKIEPAEADTEEGQRALDFIARRKYHEEEYAGGMG